MLADAPGGYVGFGVKTRIRPVRTYVSFRLLRTCSRMEKAASLGEGRRNVAQMTLRPRAIRYSRQQMHPTETPPLFKADNATL